MHGQLREPAFFTHRGSSAYAPENTIAAFESCKNTFINVEIEFFFHQGIPYLG